MKNAIEKIQVWLNYFGRVADYLSNLPINFPPLPLDKIKEINERGKQPGSAE